MRVIVCGSHKRGDPHEVFVKLDQLHAKRGIDCLAQGGAQFVDTFARQWAEQRGVPSEEYRAEWDKYGKRAGPIRNRRMLAEARPDGIVAFPGDSGTANMVEIAEAAGVPVWFPYGRESVKSSREHKPQQKQQRQNRGDREPAVAAVHSPVAMPADVQQIIGPLMEDSSIR